MTGVILLVAECEHDPASGNAMGRNMMATASGKSRLGFLRRGMSTSLVGLGVVQVLALFPSAAAYGGEAPTYHRDVVRILQKHCQDCHRPGQVAPFSLLTYEQARKRSSDIVNVTRDGLMPPWHASKSEGGPFVGARVLSDSEKDALVAWVAAKCPVGDPRDEPPAKKWSSEWRSGRQTWFWKCPNPTTGFFRP